MPPTKMLFLHLESDLEELKSDWANLAYNTGTIKSYLRQGQAQYIIELEDVIRNPYSEEGEIDDES